MCRLIWGFAGRTYHIVENLMYWLINKILNTYHKDPMMALSTFLTFFLTSLERSDVRLGIEPWYVLCSIIYCIVALQIGTLFFDNKSKSKITVFYWFNTGRQKNRCMEHIMHINNQISYQICYMCHLWLRFTDSVTRQEWLLYCSVLCVSR